MNSHSIIKTAGSAIALTAILAGCASPGYQQSQPYQNQPYPTSQNYPSSQQGYATAYGVVDSIQVVQGNTNTSPGLGTVAGVIVGGLLGNQVGGGGGRAAATVAGAVGGGLVGNNLEKGNRGAGPGLYQIGVRLDNGSYQTITQDSAADLGIGNRVRIDGGRVYRY
ncbi:MAG: glycine zipper 2TM domain-containing protein [Herminiimonas sp.]|nr:glycine zipper 2TM domain-containing protein [Herminiimonas sp.]